MPMKKPWTIASGLLASVAAGCTFGYSQAPPTVHGYQAKPFLVRRTEKMFQEGSSRSDVSDQTFARRGDGSWSFTHTGRAADGSYEQALEYFDLVRMISVGTEYVTRSVMTTAVAAAEIPRTLRLGSYPAAASKPDTKPGRIRTSWDTTRSWFRKPTRMERTCAGWRRHWTATPFEAFTGLPMADMTISRPAPSRKWSHPPFCLKCRPVTWSARRRK